MAGKLNNIQALRAFAAVAVVSFHTGFILPFAHAHAIGAFGVDVFFVISGYIMARICATNSGFFLRRRLIRILPPYWVLTLLLFLFAAKFPDLLKATRASGAELFKSLLFIPYYKSNGLLRPLLFVGWSLNYEMFFYLAIAAGLRLLPRRPMLFACALVLAFTVILHPFSRMGALPAFYGNPIMTEFVLGVLAYRIAVRVSTARAVTIRRFSLVLAIGSAAGLIFFQGWGPQKFALEWLVYALLCTALVLGSSLLSQGGWDTRLSWLILVGDASYILYLVHPYIIYFVGRVAARRLPALNIEHLPGSAAVTLVAVLIACALHVKVEKPCLRFLNDRFGGHRPSAEFRDDPATTKAA